MPKYELDHYSFTHDGWSDFSEDYKPASVPTQDQKPWIRRKEIADDIAYQIQLEAAESKNPHKNVITPISREDISLEVFEAAEALRPQWNKMIERYATQNFYKAKMHAYDPDSLGSIEYEKHMAYLDSDEVNRWGHLPKRGFFDELVVSAFNAARTQPNGGTHAEFIQALESALDSWWRIQVYERAVGISNRTPPELAQDFFTPSKDIESYGIGTRTSGQFCFLYKKYGPEGALFAAWYQGLASDPCYGGGSYCIGVQSLEEKIELIKDCFETEGGRDFLRTFVEKEGNTKQFVERFDLFRAIRDLGRKISQSRGRDVDALDTVCAEVAKTMFNKNHDKYEFEFTDSDELEQELEALADSEDPTHAVLQAKMLNVLTSCDRYIQRYLTLKPELNTSEKDNTYSIPLIIKKLNEAGVSNEEIRTLIDEAQHTWHKREAIGPIVTGYTQLAAKFPTGMAGVHSFVDAVGEKSGEVSRAIRYLLYKIVHYERDELHQLPTIEQLIAVTKNLGKADPKVLRHFINSIGKKHSTGLYQRLDDNNAVSIYRDAAHRAAQAPYTGFNSFKNDIIALIFKLSPELAPRVADGYSIISKVIRGIKDNFMISNLGHAAQIDFIAEIESAGLNEDQTAEREGECDIVGITCKALGEILSDGLEPTMLSSEVITDLQRFLTHERSDGDTENLQILLTDFTEVLSEYRKVVAQTNKEETEEKTIQGTAALIKDLRARMVQLRANTQKIMIEYEKTVLALDSDNDDSGELTQDTTNTSELKKTSRVATFAVAISKSVDKIEQFLATHFALQLCRFTIGPSRFQESDFLKNTNPATRACVLAGAMHNALLQTAQEGAPHLLLGDGSETDSDADLLGARLSMHLTSVRERMIRAIPQIEAAFLSDRVKTAGQLPIGYKVQTETAMPENLFNRAAEVLGISTTPFRLIHRGQSLVGMPAVSSREIETLLGFMRYMGIITGDFPQIQSALVGSLPADSMTMKTLGPLMLLAPRQVYPLDIDNLITTHNEQTAGCIFSYGAGVRDIGLPFDRPQAPGRLDKLVGLPEDLKLHRILGTICADAEFGGPTSQVGRQFLIPETTKLLSCYPGLEEARHDAIWVHGGSKSPNPMGNIDHARMLAVYNEAYIASAVERKTDLWQNVQRIVGEAVRLASPLLRAHVQKNPDEEKRLMKY